MRLTDLHPIWLHTEGRRGTGLAFLCPERGCRTELAVFFSNPLDGGPPEPGRPYYWHRTGDTFETLSLSPSVNAAPRGHWHGFISGGRVG